MKHQVVVIHGGDSFKTRAAYLKFLKTWQIDFERYLFETNGWKRNLSQSLGKKYDVILPDMPNKLNAKYGEWKIWFEKFIPHFKSDIVLIGHSLGGLFLVKYLAETKLPIKLKAVFLIAAPIGEGDFVPVKTFKKFEARAGKIFLYQSRCPEEVTVQSVRGSSSIPGAGSQSPMIESKNHYLNGPSETAFEGAQRLAQATPR